MERRYPTRYTDPRGVEVTTLRNDGAHLFVALRGVLFSGPDFDSLEADKAAPPEALGQFDLLGGDLCNCTIECEIPLPLLLKGREVAGTLEMRLQLGQAAPNGGIDREDLSLTLRVEGQVFRSPGKSGWFEDELLDLQAALPAGAYLKACITCAWSDYSPYGHGLFGSMACFRKLKPAYATVKGKSELFAILRQAERVQETYLCPEFERRRPNTGYRG